MLEKEGNLFTRLSTFLVWRETKEKTEWIVYTYTHKKEQINETSS